MEQENINLLFEFLNMPISNGNEIFSKFKALPNAIFFEGNEPLQKYLYIPGTREDRVVLVAHTDTAWDKAYGKEAHQNVLFKDDVFYGENEEHQRRVS